MFDCSVAISKRINQTLKYGLKQMFTLKNRRSRRDLRFRPGMDVLSDRIAPSGLQPIPLPEDDPNDCYDMDHDHYPEPVATEEDDVMIIPVGMI